MALGGLGHHMPGWIRAYSDPVLWREYRLRLTLGPAVVIGSCVAFALLGLNALIVVYGAWSIWHGATQVHGFHRIYDAKVGAVDPVTARLDLALCLAWFAAAVLHSPQRQAALLGNLYAAGGPLLDPAWVGIARTVMDAATALITIAWLFHALASRLRGAPVNPVKYLAMASSIGFWWGTLTLVDELIFGVLLWEIFHDVQYNALAWIQGRRRVEQGMESRSWERFLFRPGAGRVAFYLALAFAYGSLGILMRYDAAGSAGTLPDRAGLDSSLLLTRMVAASAILHFYFDGFIWQVRRRHFRLGLALGREAEAAAPAARGTPHPRVPHLAKWSLFILPAAVLGFRQATGRAPEEPDRWRNLAAVAPESWSIRLMSGFFEMSEGNLGTARRELEAAAELDARQPLPRQMLGDIEKLEGRIPEAMARYREAYALEPGDWNIVEGLALLHLESGDGAGAEPWLRKLTEWRPRSAWAFNHLGLVLEARGLREEAGAYYRKAVAADEGYAAARENLGRLYAR
jgi:Tfp pilus assembly protein PilF